MMVSCTGGRKCSIISSRFSPLPAVCVWSWTKDRVCPNLSRELAVRLPQSRIDSYTHQRGNEDEINVLEDGVTILNMKSVKGQEFDSVFILELERFIPFANDVERRAMYLMCTRARDNLFLVHGPEPLSRQAAQSLPGPDVLERS